MTVYDYPENKLSRESIEHPLFHEEIEKFMIAESLDSACPTFFKDIPLDEYPDVSTLNLKPDVGTGFDSPLAAALYAEEEGWVNLIHDERLMANGLAVPVTVNNFRELERIRYQFSPTAQKQFDAWQNRGKVEIETPLDNELVKEGISATIDSHLKNGDSVWGMLSMYIDTKTRCDIAEQGRPEDLDVLRKDPRSEVRQTVARQGRVIDFEFFMNDSSQMVRDTARWAASKKQESILDERNIQRFLSLTGSIYKYLYEHAYEGDTGYNADIEFGDNYLRNNQEFVSKVCAVQQDVFSSDREIASLAIALKIYDTEYENSISEYFNDNVKYRNVGNDLDGEMKGVKNQVKQVNEENETMGIKGVER